MKPQDAMRQAAKACGHRGLSKNAYRVCVSKHMRNLLRGGSGNASGLGRIGLKGYQV